MSRKMKTLIFSGLLSSLLVPMNSYADYTDCSDLITPTTDHLTMGISADGATVYDEKTDLTWQRCSVGKVWDGSTCSGNRTYINWQDALALAGSGWRIPNIKELDSIVEEACSRPAINSTAFPDVGTGITIYLSSSPFIVEDNTVWALSFYTTGQRFPSLRKNDPREVRLVYGGPLSEPIIDLQ